MVDDNQFNILAVQVLIKENFALDVDQALNGQLAVEAYRKGFEKVCGCENRAYKLIFMDVSMPVMGGLEASKLILEMQRDQALTSIVMLTAHTNQDLVEECSSMGINTVISKPLSFVRLHPVMYLNFYQMDLQEFKMLFKERF